MATHSSTLTWKIPWTEEPGRLQSMGSPRVGHDWTTPPTHQQEIAIVNTYILGISELKWPGMGEFNSDDHYIYYCRQESLRRNRVAIMVNKSPKCSTWMQSQKWQNDLCSSPRQTIQYHRNPSLCLNQKFWRNWSWTVLWRSTRPFRINIPQKTSFSS